jgi:hypothetical protein
MSDDMTDVAVIREGASLRTSDELQVVFLDDVVAIAADQKSDHPQLPYLQAVAEQWNHKLGRMRDPVSGLSHLPDAEDDDDREFLQDDVRAAESLLGDCGYVVDWNDGYVIRKEES